MTDTVARERAARFTDPELVAQLRASAGSSRGMLGSAPMDSSMDLVAHARDIARPRQRNYPVPPQVVVVPVLGCVTGKRFLGAPAWLGRGDTGRDRRRWWSGTGPKSAEQRRIFRVSPQGRRSGPRRQPGRRSFRWARHRVGACTFSCREAVHEVFAHEVHHLVGRSDDHMATSANVFQAGACDLCGRHHRYAQLAEIDALGVGGPFGLRRSGGDNQ
jgi:hypothetical protein